MFGRLTTELNIKVKVGTNAVDDFANEEHLQEWIAEKLLEFETEINGQTSHAVRMHLEPLEKESTVTSVFGHTHICSDCGETGEEGWECCGICGMKMGQAG